MLTVLCMHCSSCEQYLVGLWVDHSPRCEECPVRLCWPGPVAKLIEVTVVDPRSALHRGRAVHANLGQVFAHPVGVAVMLSIQVVPALWERVIISERVSAVQ
jgi:hypothetical protein